MIEKHITDAKEWKMNTTVQEKVDTARKHHSSSVPLSL
jgi:hypothetical protein